MGETQAPLPTDFELVRSRLRDFFARNAPWHRRLWGIGTVLSLREVLEYANGCLTGRSPSTEGLRFVVGSASREVGRDPGVAHLATELESLLRRLRVDSPKDLSRHVYDQLEQLVRRADGEYCERWRDAADDVPVEFASRAIASHLLDSGISSEHLYRWLQATASSLSTIPELAAEAAVIGAWSAVEALLIRPTERSKHHAADRLAALVACSLPRAELTPLAYRHIDAANDQLAAAIRAADTNYAKVRHVEEHLRSGGRLALTDGSEIAAQDRIVAILHDPAGNLERIRGYVTESLRRLYNQRNQIAHSGSLRSAVLTATARTSFALVGAGLDRIVHAQLQADNPSTPLQLVARAETELSLVGTPGGRSPTSLLE